MNQEEIILMARNEYGTYAFTAESLAEFANLIAAAEREACAKVCDAVQKKNEDDGAFMWEARNCAAAIRARSEQ
jgi:hypothetical protein